MKWNQSNGLLFQESDGNDTAPMTLRNVLIKLERQSIVDYELAGHTCARPAAVCQGQEEEDRPGLNNVLLYVHCVLL